MTRQHRLNKSMDVLLPQVRRESAEIDGREQTVFVRDDSVCRVCQEDVVDGRWNYCSERCREIASTLQSMFLWTSVRDRVLERDNYTCQNCGLTKERAYRAYHQTMELAFEEEENTNARTWASIWDQYGSPSHDPFEVDHIERIADGGHAFSESNLQTLCEDCHEAKTAKENREESIEQRPEIGLDEYL